MSDDLTYTLKISYAGRELAPFCDATWKDSGFFECLLTSLSWCHPKTPDTLDIDLKQKLATIRHFILPTQIDLNTPVVPIDKRTEPLFIAFMVVDVKRKPTLIDDCDYCESCGPGNPYYSLFDPIFLLPLPWAGLPEVPTDTALLPRNLLHVLCARCLYERFDQTHKYEVEHTGGIIEEIEHSPLNYLPYKRILDRNMVDSLRELSVPKQWRWQHSLNPDIPIIKGFFTPRKVTPVKNARNQ